MFSVTAYDAYFSFAPETKVIRGEWSKMVADVGFEYLFSVCTEQMPHLIVSGKNRVLAIGGDDIVEVIVEWYEQ
ncbi:hypothetical protein D3C81_1949160 [compost metagenome]